MHPYLGSPCCGVEFGLLNSSKLYRHVTVHTAHRCVDGFSWLMLGFSDKAAPGWHRSKVMLWETRKQGMRTGVWLCWESTAHWACWQVASSAVDSQLGFYVEANMSWHGTRDRVWDQLIPLLLSLAGKNMLG